MVKIRVWGITAALLAMLATSVSPAVASTVRTSAGNESEAAGLIVKYKPGILPLTADGAVTAENAAHAKLTFDSQLLKNTYVVNFVANKNRTDAQAIANRISQDPRVAAVELNTVFHAAGYQPISPKRVITPASVVNSFAAKDGYSSSAPNSAQVSLSWRKPSQLFGATITGYQLTYSSDSFTTSTTINAGNVTTYLVTGLTAGVSYGFKVRAVTTIGSTSQLGTISTVKTATPTTLPTQPQVTSGATVTKNSSTVVWTAQSFSDKGGLAVTYTVTATAAGKTKRTCSTISNSCTINGLSAGTVYSLDLVAKNSRGSVRATFAPTPAAFTPADEFYSKQWYLNGTYGINAPGAWSTTLGSSDVVVAVLDGGVTNHPQLTSHMVTGYDFVNRTVGGTDPGDPTLTTQSDWHGTHVAGIIAAAADTVGTIGVAPNVKIQSVRVLDNTGGTSADLIDGIRWAVGLPVTGVPTNATPAKVLNMSLGTDTYSTCDSFTASALADAKTAGATVISAAGNANMDARGSYPGNCYPTINVGATGISGDRSYYSNYTLRSANGAGVDISAPGGDDRDTAGAPAGTYGEIYSLLNAGTYVPGDPSYGIMEGTSMAAPVVSGVVAMLYSLRPSLTFDQVWKVISTTSSPFNPSGDCATAGYVKCGIGIINAGAAVTYVLNNPVITTP